MPTQRKKRDYLPAIVCLALPFLFIMLLLGFEPQFSASAALQGGKIRPFTYTEYTAKFRERCGDNLGMQIVATIAYPGAKAGCWASNTMGG